MKKKKEVNNIEVTFIPEQIETDHSRFISNSNEEIAKVDGYINRPIITAHVKKLIESIVKHGVLRSVVCVEREDGKLLTADGQHLLAALKELKAPVPYKAISTKNNTNFVDLMACLNSTAKKWGVKTYLQVWTWAKNHEYTKLTRIYKRYKTNIPLEHLIKIYSEEINTKRFKDGQFRIVNIRKSNKICNQMVDILNINKNFASSRRLKDVLPAVMESENYKHNLMLSYLRGHKDLMIPEKKHQMRGLFEEIMDNLTQETSS